MKTITIELSEEMLLKWREDHLLKNLEEKDDHEFGETIMNVKDYYTKRLNRSRDKIESEIKLFMQKYDCDIDSAETYLITEAVLGGLTIEATISESNTLDMAEVKYLVDMCVSRITRARRFVYVQLHPEKYKRNAFAMNERDALAAHDKHMRDRNEATLRAKSADDYCKLLNIYGVNISSSMFLQKCFNLQVKSVKLLSSEETMKQVFEELKPSIAV